MPIVAATLAHLARPVLFVDEVKKFLAPLPIETLAVNPAV